MADARDGVAVEAVGRTDVGVVRSNNEDTFLIASLTTDEYHAGRSAQQYEVGERGVLLAVSDGMGGAQAGEVASLLTVQSLRMHLRDAADGRVPDQVSAAVRRASRDVHTAGKSTGREGMGATLSAVLLQPSRAHIVSVGDSRVYILRERRIRRVTKDQSYTALLVSTGVPEEQAKRSPFRNVILQSVGQEADVVAAIGYIRMRRGDVFLLCTDGLWEKVSDEEMYKVVTGEAGLGAAADRLVAMARERGGEDNITVVLGRVDGAGLPAPFEGESLTETYDTIQEYDPMKGGT